MENGKDIMIQFINMKDNQVLLNKDNNKLPTIHIKEDYYSLDNIEYYLSLYLNIKVDNLKNIKDEYYYFDTENELKDYIYTSIENIDDTKIKDIINEL